MLTELPVTVPSSPLDTTAISGAPAGLRRNNDFEIHDEGERADVLQDLAQQKKQEHVFEACIDGEAEHTVLVEK